MIFVNNCILYLSGLTGLAEMLIVKTSIVSFRCMMFQKREGFVFTRQKINNCNVLVCDGETTFSTDGESEVYSSK